MIIAITRPWEQVHWLRSSNDDDDGDDDNDDSDDDSDDYT